MPDKVPVSFGEWRPDLSFADTGQFAAEALNVFTDAGSYYPFPGFARFTTSALPGRVCGLTIARTTLGGWEIYAGTPDKLWLWGYAGWTDVSRLAGGAYHVVDGELWQFEQSGHNLVAVNTADVPQVLNIDSGSNFTALAGTPPTAGQVRQIGDFLVLSHLASNDRIIQWSAINDITGWSPGLSLSDTQEFPDGGAVQGVAGSEIGYVVQERAIRVMQFLPGDSNFIFNFSRILYNRGCISKYGFVSVANVLFFLAEDGFFSMAGPQLMPIGDDKVNRWFRAHSDPDRWDIVQAFAFPNKPIVAWAFHSFSGAPIYDHLLLYDYTHQKWTHCAISAQVWSSLATPGLDLDTTGTEPGDILADSTARPLDSFAYIGGRPFVGGIDSDGYGATLSGPNLAATIDSVEAHLVPGYRTFIRDAYPLIDAVNATVAVATRERMQDPVVFGAPVGIEITGSGALFSSARLHRFRVQTLAAESWTHAQGVLVEAQQDGSVA